MGGCIPSSNNSCCQNVANSRFHCPSTATKDIPTRNPNLPNDFNHLMYALGPRLARQNLTWISGNQATNSSACWIPGKYDCPLDQWHFTGIKFELQSSLYIEEQGRRVGKEEKQGSILNASCCNCSLRIQGSNKHTKCYLLCPKMNFVRLDSRYNEII